MFELLYSSRNMPDMPGSDKPGLEWQGIVQVVEAAPTKITSSGEGAVITAGVAKILTIYSAAPKPTLLIYYIIAIVVVVIVIAAAISAVILRARRAQGWRQGRAGPQHL